MSLKTRRRAMLRLRWRDHGFVCTAIDEQEKAVTIEWLPMEEIQRRYPSRQELKRPTSE